MSNKQRTSTDPILMQASGHSPTARCRVEPVLDPAVWPTTMGFTENPTCLFCCFLPLLLALLDSCGAYDLLSHTPSKVWVHRVAVGDLYLAGIEQHQPSHQSVYSALASLSLQEFGNPIRHHGCFLADHSNHSRLVSTCPVGRNPAVALHG